MNMGMKNVTTSC